MPFLPLLLRRGGGGLLCQEKITLRLDGRGRYVNLNFNFRFSSFLPSIPSTHLTPPSFPLRRPCRSKWRLGGQEEGELLLFSRVNGTKVGWGCRLWVMCGYVVCRRVWTSGVYYAWYECGKFPHLGCRHSPDLASDCSL